MIQVKLTFDSLFALKYAFQQRLNHDGLCSEELADLGKLADEIVTQLEASGCGKGGLSMHEKWRTIAERCTAQYMVAKKREKPQETN